MEPNAIAERYVAVWHQPDETGRRQAIADVWARDGAYVDPTFDARGYDAIERVVTSVHDEYVKTGEYFFRACGNAQAHHNVLRFNWVLVQSATAEVADSGQDILVLNSESQIENDYKFIDSAVVPGQFAEFIDRYVAMWQEPDEESRRKLVTELWAPDGTQVFPAGEPSGHQAMFERVTRSFNLFNQSGEYAFRSTGDANGHHNLVRFNWEMVRTDNGEVADVGFELFVRDDADRIRFDYQFIGPASPADV